jgi:hypothetical protein
MTSQQLLLRDYGLPAPTSIYYMVIGGGGYGGNSEYPVYGAGGGSGADTNNYDASPVSITKGTTYTVTVPGPNGTASFGNLFSAGGGYDAGTSSNGANSNSYSGGSGSGNTVGGGGAGSRSTAQSANDENQKGGDGGSGTYLGNVPGRPGGGGLGGYYYSGGGGGGSYSGFKGFGIDGGGDGGWYNDQYGKPANVQGGGGGGGSWNSDNSQGRPGGAGGQGLVHIWYSQNLALPNSVNGANTGTDSGYRYYTFNGSGSITW